MLLRLATFGALGYAAYKFYDSNRDQVDETFRGLFGGDRAEEYAGPAGGPLSSEARVVHAGEGPVG